MTATSIGMGSALRDPSAAATTLQIAVVLAFAGALRLWYFGGIVGSDDASIASHSLKILEHGFETPFDHYGIRTGLTLPLALIFALFGVGEFQMAVIPLFWSLVGVWTAYLIGMHVADRRAGLLAAGALALFPLDVELATRLFPDVPLGAACGATVYLMLRARDAERPYPWAVGAGLLWGYAYLVRVEAGLLIFVLLTLWAQRPAAWRPLFIAAATCGAVFFVENLYYYLDVGQILHHLRVVQGTSDAAMNEAYSGRQLWAFPKAWFVTPYQFGLHYYAMFIGLGWIVLARKRHLYFAAAWVVVMLIWLQFGGNPFSETVKFKTHLSRYCALISVPMAVIIGAAVAALPRRAGILSAAAIGVVGLLGANFSSLGGERETATKMAVRQAVANGWLPLWLDAGSHSIAWLLLTGRPEREQVHSLQKHDFKTGKTHVTSLKEAQDYLLLNEALMRFKERRYGMVPPERVGPERDVLFKVDNPMNPSAYWQARVMSAAAGLLPGALREKVQGTARELLEPGDAVVYGPLK